MLLPDYYGTGSFFSRAFSERFPGRVLWYGSPAKAKARIQPALETAARREIVRLERGLVVLEIIVGIAPLLGLLGTVLGFIQTFGRMQEAGLNAHIGQLSAGVWQALICAAAGLAVAIPAHACYNYLVSRINSIVLDMERSATEIVQIVTEGVKPKPTP